MHGKRRSHGPNQPGDPQVLHNDGVGPGVNHLRQVVRRPLELIREDQGIEGDISPNPVAVQVGQGFGECREGEVGRPMAGVEVIEAEIDGVGTVRDGGPQGFGIAGRSQQFRKNRGEQRRSRTVRQGRGNARESKTASHASYRFADQLAWLPPEFRRPLSRGEWNHRSPGINQSSSVASMEPGSTRGSVPPSSQVRMQFRYFETPTGASSRESISLRTSSGITPRNLNSQIP